jgi:hypothetical protein
MPFTRDQLSERFAQLDAELAKLKAQAAPEEVLWDAFEALAQLPTSLVDHRDRVWWWQQVYDAMERHGLTDLSREHVQREFP